MSSWRFITLVGCLVLASACAGPINAVRVDPTVVQADLGRSATTTGEPSWPTRNVLFEHGLGDAFAERPEAALAELHRAMVADYPIRNVSVYRYRDKGLITLKSPLNYEPIGIALAPAGPLLLNWAQNFVTVLINSGTLSALQRTWFEDASWVPELK